MIADGLVNVRLLSHPINWLIVWTVLLFAGFAFAMINEQLTGVNTPTAAP
jgi:hypothetical protein